MRDCAHSAEPGSVVSTASSVISSLLPATGVALPVHTEAS